MTGADRNLSPATERGILMDRPVAGIRQHDTHKTLTDQVESGNAQRVPLSLDAIIVPGTRPAESLDHAVTLARAANCQLLILCSHRQQGAEVTEFLAARSFRRAIVIDLPPDYSHALLKFPKLDSIRDELPSECAFYATDLSMKRNIGLILARMLQWQRVFFLDDDIRDIAYPDLQATVDMLGSFPTAGMWVTEFPDNSIVCHANRTTGRPQDVFVSGAALAVDSTQDISFFPDIYNEDWLFFFDNVASKRLANSGLKATQLTYYPFANPRRAAWQEFGDVLAEGLYALLHLGGNVEHATPQYWSVFLEARRNFLEGILTRSQNADEQVRDEMAESVSAALKSLLHIKPEVCARYVQSWRWDLAHWKRRMAGVPAMPSVGQALAELGLAPTKPASTWKVMPHWDDPQPTVTAGPASIPQFDTLNRMRGNAEGLRDRLAVSEERQPTLPLPVVTDEPHGRHRASRHNIASLYHKLRTAGRPAHRATPTDRPAPATPESVILVNSNPGSLRTAEELAPRLTDTHALHSRHLMSHCYSVVFADGERQAPAPLCRRYRAPAR